MILILCRAADEHVPYVTAKLKTLGAEYFCFDAANFPARAEVRVMFEPTGLIRRVLRCNGKEIDLAGVTAVWNRGRTTPSAAAEVRPENKLWVADACTSWLVELWESLDCLWVPDRPRTDREPYRPGLDPVAGERLGVPPVTGPSAYSKLNQLTVAARLGFRIPQTLVTNSPEGFLGFCSQFEGRVITKAVLAPRISRDGEMYVPYTHMMRRRDAANYRAVRYAPVIVQEYVPKRLELRVTVVGSSVFAAAIHSQRSRLTRDDWRRETNVDDCSSYYERHSLPDSVGRLCVRLVQTLGLCFGAIDLILTPDGDYVFLEINPNGQWNWVQDLTGLPIAEAIARLLVRGAVGPVEEETDASRV